MAKRQVQPCNSADNLRNIGEPSTPDLTEGTSAHNTEPSHQTRKRKRPVNDVTSSHAQRANLHDVAQTFSQPLTFHATEGAHNHLETNVITDTCHQPQTQKRKRHKDQASTRRIRRSNSNGDAHNVGEPSIPYMIEGAHTPVQTNVITDACDQPQTQKRKRRAYQVTPRCTRRLNSNSNMHSIGEPSTPYVIEGTSAQSQTQKRDRRRGQPSRRSVRQRCFMTDLQPNSNDSLHNVGQGSTSYATEGDCTEWCHHCNAAFWHGELLKGHDFQNGQAVYHLCYANGKIFMQPEADPPDYIKHLLAQSSFMENISAYNQMFAMNSFSATVDNTVNHGRGPYVFKVSGQIDNRIGSLCPTGDDDPKFLQLYIYDTHNEVQNRLNRFPNSERATLDPQVMQGLIHFLDAHNELVQIFRTARDKCAEADVPEFKVRLYSGDNWRGYELPVSQNLGGIVFDCGPESESNYDVVLEYKDGPLKRISKLHKSYMSL